MTPEGSSSAPAAGADASATGDTAAPTDANDGATAEPDSAANGTEASDSSSTTEGSEAAEPNEGEQTSTQDEATAESKAPVVAQREKAPDDATASESSEINVSLKSLNPQDYAALLAEHRGKVIFIDFWATWCIPCRRDFPHTVEWSRTFDKDDLAVISISVDEPEVRETVLHFLKKQQAEFPNYISSVGAAEEAFDAFELDSGGVPHYKVYDREGNLVRKFYDDPDNTYDHTDIEQTIRDTLGS